MRRFIKIIILIFIAGGVFLFARFVVGGPEDDWICENGGWVRHGNPSMQMPDYNCESGEENEVNEMNSVSVESGSVEGNKADKNVTSEKKLVEEYIKQNISQISPVSPVLGGSWYVVSVEFLDDGLVDVVYEDGHIQENIRTKYSVDKNGGVKLIDLQRTPSN